MYKILQSLDSKVNDHHKRYSSTNSRQELASRNILNSNDYLDGKNQCIIHKKRYISFCTACNKDICSSCVKKHVNHYCYEYKDLIPTDKEIKLLKNEFKKYFHDYKMLLNEILFWKKLLDKKIEDFTNNIQMITSNDDIQFVENFNSVNNSNYYELMRFRKMYSLIMLKKETDINNNIFTKQNDNNINMPFYNRQDFLMSKNVLKEVISSNNDLNNMNKFLSSSSMIINYIIELNKKCEHFSIEDKKKKILRRIYQTNTFSGKNNCRLKYANDRNKKYDYGDNKIIEKFIDFKEFYGRNKTNKNVSTCNSTSITPKNNPLKSILKNGNKNNSSSSYSEKTSYTSTNIVNTPKKCRNSSETIYAKKCATPKIFDNFNQIDNIYNKNYAVDLVLNSTEIIKGDRHSNKSSSIRNNKLMKSFKSSNLSENSSVVHNNNNYLNYKKPIYNLKQNNFIYGAEQKEKQVKTYIHKKLVSNNIINNNQEFGDRKTKYIQNKLINNYYTQNINDKFMEYDNLSLNEKKYNGNNYQRIKKNNNEIKSSLFKSFKQKDQSRNKNEEEKKCNYPNENIPKIIMTKYEDKFIIDGKKPLYIGLDLGDTECKLSLINQLNNEIKIICFKKDSYNIPTVIYFDEKKDDIIIGADAENLGIKNSTQIVFNLLKLINVNYDEIIGRKELWPFKIYKDESINKPYIKINYNGQNGKEFYFEDILSLFIQQLFEIFFKKIILTNNSSNNINLYLELSLPNYLNFLQKKIIEKLLQNNIFYDNNSYNGYNIYLQNIKLENATNLANLYNDLSNINNYEKNILVLLFDGCSINLSIINKKRMLFEVKGIESAAFGEDDFIENYMCYCLSNLDKNLNDEILKSPSYLYQLRKTIVNTKKNFNKNPQTQLEFSMLSEEGTNIENKKVAILLRKTDFEKTCKDFFIKINNLIKNILNQAKLSEMDIDDIILIGETSKSSTIKLILFDIFKNNEKINKILLQLDSNTANKEILKDNLISIGCALQLMNNNNLLTSKYLFTDITPYSFGIETLDGLMDIIIQKGKKLPYKNKRIIKIRNTDERICINIFEGDDMYVKNNIFITCASIDKSNFKGSNDKDYIDVLVQLEIDCNYDLKCHIIDPKTNNKFECLINVDVVKS